GSRRYCAFGRPRIVVGLFHQLLEGELVAVARDGADEARLAGIVAERAAQRADGLAERAVRDDDVAPHVVEDLAPVNGFVPPFDQEHEQVEVARNERELTSIAEEETP